MLCSRNWIISRFKYIETRWYVCLVVEILDERVLLQLTNWSFVKDVTMLEAETFFPHYELYFTCVLIALSKVKHVTIKQFAVHMGLDHYRAAIMFCNLLRGLGTQSRLLRYRVFQIMNMSNRLVLHLKRRAIDFGLTFCRTKSLISQAIVSNCRF